jgi:hypothetical protein
MIQIEKVENHRVGLQDQINQLEIIMDNQNKENSTNVNRLAELEAKADNHEEMKE